MGCDVSYSLIQTVFLSVYQKRRVPQTGVSGSWMCSCCLLMCKEGATLHQTLLPAPRRHYSYTYLITAIVKMALFLLLFCGDLLFIQAPGSGIISMQMFFTVNSCSDLGESRDESKRVRDGGKHNEIFFYSGRSCSSWRVSRTRLCPF